MYKEWIKISERDLVQKGASVKVIKQTLKIEKVVLNMTLKSVSQGSTDGAKLSANSSPSAQTGNSSVDPFGRSASDLQQGLLVLAILAVISGQRPILTKAKKSIANWKVRKNQILGGKVTLRGKLALEFLDKTIRLGCASVEDTLGLPLRGRSNSGESSRTQGSGLGDQSSGAAVQSLGNISLGIPFRGLSMYPELESLGLAQTSFATKGGLGLDLSVNFRSVKPLRGSISSTNLQGSATTKGLKLGRNTIQSNTRTAFIGVGGIAQLVLLRKLYLTTLGLKLQPA